LIVHVLLVLVVAGELLFLSSVYRVRADLTADGLYSFSASTHSILDRIDEPLRIEAYFTDPEVLDDTWREGRTRINAYLDELVRVGRGRLSVEYLDPGSDQQIEDRARRIGIQELNLSRADGSSTRITRGWQGLRLRYGTRAEVLPLLRPNATQSPQLEAQITPLMKLVTTPERIKVGFMEWPFEPKGRRGDTTPKGWGQVRQTGDLPGRYEWINLRATDGVLVPDDIDLLVLFRPKGLDKRTKFVIDQHLMRGGTVLAFVDMHEFSYATDAPFHPFARQPTFRIDAVGHGDKYGFVRQMAHYGVVMRDEVLGDGYAPAHETFQTPVGQGQQALTWAYPFFIHPVHVDWSRAAESFAKTPTDDIDMELLRRFQKRLTWGMDPDSEFTQPFLDRRIGPGFYFPTPLELADPMPDGVEGRIVFRSSPVSVGLPTPDHLDWLGTAPQYLQRNFEQAQQEFLKQLQASPRRQIAMMVDLTGRFTSFYAGKEIPYRPGMEPRDDEPSVPRAGDPAVGPELPPPADAGAGRNKDADPEPRTVAAEGARLLVVGDSEMVRDDLLTGQYARIGGPYSQAGATFFAHLLDNLSGDRELLALYRRYVPSRGQSYAERDLANEPQEAFERRVRATEWWWRSVNVMLPILCLVVLGGGVAMVRRRQKRQFLGETHQLRGATAATPAQPSGDPS